MVCEMNINKARKNLSQIVPLKIKDAEFVRAYNTLKKTEFKRTHSLTYLLDLISEKIDISEKLYSYVEKLESFAVEVRYPDDMYEPTPEEVKGALNAAIKIKTFVLSKIKIK